MSEQTTNDWEIVIGLEVHAQITSRSKLFSGSSSTFGGEPNSRVSFLDAAMPGTLPVINKYCVEQAVRTGLGLNAKINKYSVFDRKNYFYPDLPANYQISQYKQPIVGEGKIEVELSDGKIHTIGIERLHLEQDAGKSLHDQSPSETYVDLNRSGVALMEIVSKPDLRNAEQAGAYILKLRNILRYLGTCDGNMEEGSLRCDVNVSVRRPGQSLGKRCEIKNVNSVRFVKQAIEYEAQRQIEIIEGGGSISQETRLFDSNAGITRAMRSKEEAHDYRYFPDPDLMPLQLSQDFIDSIRSSLPELPDEKKTRLIDELGLSEYDATVIASDKGVAEYFEQVANGCDAKFAANWVTGVLFGKLNECGHDIGNSPVGPIDLRKLLELVSDGELSARQAKEVFDEMFEFSKTAAEVVHERGLKQLSDTVEIERIISAVLIDNKEKVEEYRGGKVKLYGFFVGQVMKLSQGRANPKLVNEILRVRLDT